MNSPPTDATHVHHFYGHSVFYKRVEEQYLNQVTEEWQTVVRWFWWNGKEWRRDEPPRLAEPIEKES